MAIHRIQKTLKDRLRSAVPFGLAHTKPNHFKDMAVVAWENRDNLGYGWKVLSQGVCDGCALGVAGFHDWTIDGVHLCMTRLNLLRLNTMPEMDIKTLADIKKLSGMDNRQLRGLGRLPYPMLRKRGDPGFRRISWDKAYGRIADRIRNSRPERLAFYLTSRGLTNETYYVAQKAARYLGTNSIENAARLCHSPSTGAMRAAIGVAATTCSYSDWWKSDLVVFFGSNPANDQPVTMKYLHQAKKNGTKVAMVNPFKEPGMDRYWVPSVVTSAVFGTDISDYWFPVAQGGDIAFLYGVLRVLFEKDWVDHEFIQDHTTGFADLKAAVMEQDWAALEARSGLKRQGMEEFAGLIRDARKAVLVWSMGITQHSFGGHAVQMIVNLGLAKGYVGRDGCGLMPIRGHSGVQGGAEMGAYATAYPGGRPVNAENARWLSSLYGFDVPDAMGLTATEMVEGCARGEVDLLYSAGGNFLRTLPQPDAVKEALERTPLRVHQDIIVTDQMLLEPGEEVILLPAKTRYEQEGGGTETTTERRVIFSPEIPRQVGEAREEWKILRDVALAADPSRAHLFGCETAEEIRDEIARAVPFYDGIQRLKKTGDQFQYGGPHLCGAGRFPTPDGKARFVPAPLPEGLPAEGFFDVSTRRGKQFNTLIYAEDDPLTGAPRDAVFMNPDDAARLRLRQWDRVALVNGCGRLEARVFFAAIAPGNLQVHWPEGNVIVQRGVVDTLGKVPDYNARVRVEALHS
jgi:molybdopterin-dependent oxidoreductase alpha subunit